MLALAGFKPLLFYESREILSTMFFILSWAKLHNSDLSKDPSCTPVWSMNQTGFEASLITSILTEGDLFDRPLIGRSLSKVFKSDKNGHPFKPQSYNFLCPRVDTWTGLQICVCMIHHATTVVPRLGLFATYCYQARFFIPSLSNQFDCDFYRNSIRQWEKSGCHFKFSFRQLADRYGWHRPSMARVCATNVAS